MHFWLDCSTLGVILLSKHKGHYIHFNVMNEKEHWDSHTREIVEKRLTYHEFPKDAPLDYQEVHTLHTLCAILLDETCEQILSYMLHHFQTKLTSDIGEAQRKKDIPKESLLIGEGLLALNLFCINQYNNFFHSLDDEAKKDLINKMLQGNISLETSSRKIPAQEFIKKILTEAVSSYYSHPQIWSEIGYAGPAYPRGYVRSELGLTDPWEARRKNEESS